MKLQLEVEIDKDDYKNLEDYLDYFKNTNYTVDLTILDIMDNTLKIPDLPLLKISKKGYKKVYKV